MAFVWEEAVRSSSGQRKSPRLGVARPAGLFLRLVSRRDLSMSGMKSASTVTETNSTWKWSDQDPHPPID
jgi:hypothetical protein